MPRSPNFEESVGSGKSGDRALAVILLGGVLFLFAMKFMLSNDGSERQGWDNEEEIAQVEELEQDTDFVDPDEDDLVREEVNVSQPGEERDFEIAPGVMMTFCWIPPGEFVMGSPTTEDGRQDHEAQVKVTLSKGFWLGKYEVTQAQWVALVVENPSSFKGDRLPVEQVTWTEVRDWCVDLNANGGSEDDPDGAWRYGLPTEAQWEYAARAGTSTGLNSGKDLTTQAGFCRNLAELGWYEKNSGNRTHPVGQKKPNAWGLHDMHGNVWEWCGDWYGDALPGGVNPKGAASGAFRVLRGGSWVSNANNCRVAIRSSSRPTGTFISFGFRVARSSVP